MKERFRSSARAERQLGHVGCERRIAGSEYRTIAVPMFLSTQTDQDRPAERGRRQRISAVVIRDLDDQRMRRDLLPAQHLRFECCSGMVSESAQQRTARSLQARDGEVGILARSACGPETGPSREDGDPSSPASGPRSGLLERPAMNTAWSEQIGEIPGKIATSAVTSALRRRTTLHGCRSRP